VKLQWQVTCDAVLRIVVVIPNGPTEVRRAPNGDETNFFLGPTAADSSKPSLENDAYKIGTAAALSTPY
jgi:hypothetical protein